MNKVFTDKQKRDAALREVRMRRRVYPRWVQDGKMTEEDAAREITIMQAIADDYQRAIDIAEPKML